MCVSFLSYVSIMEIETWMRGWNVIDGCPLGMRGTESGDAAAIFWE